jgi:hypothetical protein
MGIKVTGDSVDDNLTPDWSFEKRLSAGLFNQLNAITLDSQENIHKLTVTSLLSGQTESDLVKTGRKIPLTKWGSVSERAGLTFKYAEIVPRIIDHFVPAKLSWVIGHQFAIADHFDPFRTCSHGCSFTGQFAVNTIVVPVIPDQTGA